MATLHLMVGLPCSGKTTLARRLEDERSALRLTPDEWQLRLFGQDAEEPEHNARHSLIEALLWELASRALVLGTRLLDTERTRRLSPTTFHISEEMMKPWIAFFQKPTPDELERGE
ncbi:MAG TPA: AAA family ATPase [Polyangiaceae bacterium]|nr:AAA family ATPase [Polyangiaceae bacterium]